MRGPGWPYYLLVPDLGYQVFRHFPNECPFQNTASAMTKLKGKKHKSMCAALFCVFELQNALNNSNHLQQNKRISHTTITSK